MFHWQVNFNNWNPKGVWFQVQAKAMLMQMVTKAMPQVNGATLTMATRQIDSSTNVF